MGRSTRICLLTEDTYAPSFIERVIDKLKEEGLVSRDINLVKREHTYGKYNPCSPKLGRIIKAIEDSCDKIIIFVDADGQDVEKVRNDKVLRHVANVELSKVYVVVFRYEIE